MYMLENWLFVLALIAVLMIPGPSNALLASSAHHHGIWRTVRFLPAQLVGYFYGIALWGLVIHLTDPIWPAFIHLLHVLAVGYVFWLAMKLWKTETLHEHSQQHTVIRTQHIFWGSLKNPKAILIATAILPPMTWQSTENYAIVMTVVALIMLPSALFWIYFGKKWLDGDLKRVDGQQLYKGSAMLLLLCMVPIILQFF